MPTFRYEAAQANAQVEAGELEADSARAVRAALRARGLVAIKVEPVERAYLGSRTTRRRISSSDLALATRQLASLVSAGLPLAVALSTLVEQAEDEALREVLRAVRGDINSGHRLADALARHPKVFPQVYWATIAAGEQAGSFGTVLERLAQYLEDRQALRSKLLAAATYPAIVTLVAFGIVFFLMSYVVPQVVEVFQQTRQTLPLPTRVLLALSGFFRVFGVWLLLALLGVGWALRAWLSRPGPRTLLDRRTLRVPFLGRLISGIDTARFAATMAMLTEAGVPILRALAAAEATLGNRVLRGAVLDAIERVREGSTLARALTATKAFPPVLIRLIEVGEATGQLPKMLGHAARNQAYEVERRATAFATLLEPVLILLMGAAVLGIVVAVLMPIIEINQIVR
jgi:general secretion pathway protein F